MDQLQQCAVCTLYLHNGMSMEEHLDTHPKDQVIRALCKISGRGFGSRCTTPAQSERSYCSRSRTPASTLDGHSTKAYPEDKDRRKRSVRTPAPRYDTPSDAFRSDALYDTSNANTVTSPSSCYTNRPDPPTYTRSGPSSDASQYVYTQDPPEELEVKYSRSDEYNLSQGRTADNFNYNIPLSTPRVRPAPRIRSECFDVFPKTSNNIALLKSNVAPVQYVNQSVKPVQFMVPTPQGFVQAQQNNNVLLSGSVNEMLQPVNGKGVVGPMFNQINHMASGASPFTPGTTVVTQNSQFFYREMVHNIDGKPYLSAVPAVVSVREDLASTTTNPIYQNVMVVNPYTTGACMYPPQHIMASTSNLAGYEQSVNFSHDKRGKSGGRPNEVNQTLIIEVGPIQPDTIPVEPSIEISVSEGSVEPSTSSREEQERKAEQDFGKTKKGLKILSNIKVEVPIQHHKSMLHGVMDLTEDGEVKIIDNSSSIDDNSVPDVEETKPQSDPVPCNSETDSSVVNTFSVIKNIGNPSVYRESPPKCTYTEPKVDIDQNDSCSIPDLTCKEKASISPCSELSGDFVDNSMDSNPPSIKDDIVKIEQPLEMFRNNNLLNNLYVKKSKKILQIKNFKSSSNSVSDSQGSIDRPTPLSERKETKTEESTTKNEFSLPPNLVETFKQNNIECSSSKQDATQASPCKTDRDSVCHSIDFDADTEEQSMDIEPISHASSYKEPFDQIAKVETNSCDKESTGEKKEFAQLETMRPVNVIAYGNMSHFDSNKEFESTKDRFVSMMSDNYFGDNIIGDYFTAERSETFTHVNREERRTYEVQKTELPALEEEQSEYMWGESSHMLPNFMQEGYKVGEYGVGAGLSLEDSEYAELRCRGTEFDRVSKVEETVAETVDISADERMPPRGELSAQESNGDMDAPWSGMYHINSSTSYDLIARETWVSDGSDVDTVEKPEHTADQMGEKVKIHLTKRTFKCATCARSFNCPKERRVHRAKEHPMPSTATSKTHRQIRRRLSIKKEDKMKEILYQSAVLTKVAAPISSTLEDMLDTAIDTKDILKTEVVIKEEPRRRRRDYVCPVCKVDFQNEVSFNGHLKMHPLECLTCGKYFYRRANLQLHLRTHLAIKNYKCEVCEKRFTTKQKLVEHHNIHTGAAPVKCNLCNATFRRHSNMIQHRNRHHFHIKKKLRDYVCHCGEVYHSRRKLLWHKETHDGKPKACSYCSDKFVHAASLTRHIRRAHNKYYVPNDARPRENIECPICKQVYLKNNIEMHIQTHTGKKMFSCVICSKAFSTKWNLKLHHWTHANRSAKPYKCALCKGAFIRQADYVSHMNAHKSVRPYTCNYCGCQFIRKYNCQRHVKEHETMKKYVCKVPECGKMFHRSYYLTEHMRVHSGARPFSCNICGKTSSNKSNHNKHIKIHHAREPVATEG